MIIDQLPLLDGDVLGTDEVPIERGTTTYKTTKAALVKSAADAAAAAQTAAENAQTAAENVGASLATYVRPNLLDNWYFVGGGSQLGYGVFPVNQRGQTNYSNPGFCIDRWRLESGSSITVNSDYVKLVLDNSTNYKAFKSVVTGGLREGTYTVSFLCKVNSVSGDVRIGARVNDIVSVKYMINLSTTTDYQIFQKTFTLTEVSKVEACIFGFNNTNSTADIDIKAVKIELGSNQTLAHQGKGVWVLNEIPDNATELAKCQAYYIKTSAVSEYSCSLGLDGSNPRITIPLPVTMAKAPTFTKSGADGFQFGVGTTRVSVGGSSDSIQISGNYGTVLFPNAVRINFQTSASIGAAFLPCVVELPAFELSAE